MVIFHKTEIQTVILRCLTNLNLNWFQRYDKKRKKAKNANLLFLMYVIGTGKGNICILCHNFWANDNLDPLSISKWPSEPQFCERKAYIWQKSGQKRSYSSHLRVTFVSDRSLLSFFLYLLFFCFLFRPWRGA